MYQIVRKTVCLTVCTLLLLILLAGCSKTHETVASQPASETIPSQQIKSGIQTVLMASVKDFTPEAASLSYRNSSKSDMLMLMILDASGKTITALQINPDTVVSFTPQGTQDKQNIPLGEVFSFGSGGSDSCLNQVNALSQLLGGIPIPYYMFFTRDSVGIVNKMLGGIRVDVLDDFPASSPELVKDSSVLLSADGAETFFDYRSEDDITNQEHMRRQQQYIAEAFSPFMQKVQTENFLTKLTVQLGDRLETNMTLSQMAQMMEYMGECRLDETIHTLSGTAEKNGNTFCFYVDSDSVSKTVSALFYD